jgi:hypothetical protein
MTGQCQLVSKFVKRERISRRDNFKFQISHFKLAIRG